MIFAHPFKSLYFSHNIFGLDEEQSAIIAIVISRQYNIAVVKLAM
jgi:hypothetical protein